MLPPGALSCCARHEWAGCPAAAAAARRGACHGPTVRHLVRQHQAGGSVQHCGAHAPASKPAQHDAHRPACAPDPRTLCLALAGTQAACWLAPARPAAHRSQHAPPSPSRLPTSYTSSRVASIRSFLPSLPSGMSKVVVGPRQAGNQPKREASAGKWLIAGWSHPEDSRHAAVQRGIGSSLQQCVAGWRQE